MAKKNTAAHPFAETRPRFPEDILLRENKFSIYKRWGSGPKKIVIWRRNKQLFSHEAALKLIDQNDLADAQYMEMLMGQGME